MNFRPSRWGAVLSLSLVLGLCTPGPSAWAARSARGASKAGKAKAKARKGPQPKLLAPVEDAELQPGRVVFMWRVAAKRARLEVARDAEFTDTVFDKPVKGLQAAFELEPGTYYWRVTGPRGMPSDPRRLTVASLEPQPQASPEPRAEASPESQPIAAGGLGLDLTGSTTPSTEAPTGLDLSGTDPASAAPSPVAAPPEPVVAEAERASQRERSQKMWSVFVGGSAAYGSSAPNAMATMRYEASVALRLANPFELSLAVGGTSLRPLGTRDASWPSFEWLGQYYFDLGARYRLVRFDGGSLYGLVSGRLSFFTAAPEQLGYLVDRGPLSAGAGIAFRFRAGLPMELGLRGNLLTGKALGGELELGLRVLVF